MFFKLEVEINVMESCTYKASCLYVTRTIKMEKRELFFLWRIERTSEVYNFSSEDRKVKTEKIKIINASLVTRGSILLVPYEDRH